MFILLLFTSNKKGVLKIWKSLLKFHCPIFSHWYRKKAFLDSEVYLQSRFKYGYLKIFEETTESLFLKGYEKQAEAAMTLMLNSSPLPLILIATWKSESI